MPVKLNQKYLLNDGWFVVKEIVKDGKQYVIDVFDGKGVVEYALCKESLEEFIKEKGEKKDA